MQILEEKQELYFHLQQQRLIELIRQGKTEEALEFAQDTLAPQGEENPEFLEELGELPTTCFDFRLGTAATSWNPATAE